MGNPAFLCPDGNGNGKGKKKGLRAEMWLGGCIRVSPSDRSFSKWRRGVG
jgi:hypothetical protein